VKEGGGLDMEAAAEAEAAAVAVDRKKIGI
jgi:hypothetical protein